MTPWLTLLAPLLSAALILLVFGGARRISAGISVAAAAVAFVGACMLFGAPESSGHHRFVWLSVGPEFEVSISMVVDRLSKSMMLVVTGVGLLVHVFSLGYMKEDAGKSRYFAGLSLFLFSMMGIVLADNFVMMFLFWELVGVSSYILIGHWYDKPAAADAGKKAFITNRIGDFGFLLGILLTWAFTGSFVFEEIRLGLEAIAPNATVVTAAALLVFCGAVGKSAQFPLHVWLPDAMEGPTPVSALIHAATMVAAGVYMLVRVDFLIAASSSAQMVIASVGAATALLAALMATQQNDIKRVLAYSTLSQLGYMVIAVGVLASSAAMFHLITHAFFKALLFLGAGAIIHSMHHEQDMWKMGGLKNKMPVTFLTFLVGTLALTGFPGLSGFFSKDAILLSAYAYRPVFFWIGWGTAVLTAFYMFRLFLVVFTAKPNSEAAKHAGEAPGTMTAPLVILAVLSVVAGYGFFIDHFYKHIHHHEGLPGWLVPLAVSAFFIGAAAAFALYRGRNKDPIHIPLFANNFHFDELYGWLVTRVQGGTATAASWFDKWVLDGILVRGGSGLAWAFGYCLRFIQTGNLQSYSFLFGLGAVAFIYFLIFR